MIYLASTSPRRRALLEQAGIKFSVVSADVSECYPRGMSPTGVVTTLAARKARAATVPCAAGDAVLGADTVVALDGRILGKPHDEKEAADMLRMLSGRWHEVFTGFCLQTPEQMVCGVSKTSVCFFQLSEEEIFRYIATGEPLDKAGAYGIQGLGVRLVREIQGDYNTVVGLPVAKIFRLLKRLGISW